MSNSPLGYSSIGRDIVVRLPIKALTKIERESLWHDLSEDMGVLQALFGHEDVTKKINDAVEAWMDRT